MKTVAQRWEEASKAMIPPGAGATQRQEVRRAFYFGFWCCLQAGLEMAGESGANDDIGATMIERMHQECREFQRAVAEGRA